MAKEFEGLNQAIQDILGTLDKTSSDAKLLKEVEKYIKEDPLAYLGWQMYKMNLVNLRKSEQPFGENLIKFDNGRKIELGGIYSQRGAKAIPVRTGAEKSENVVVFDENAKPLGSVIYAQGAREESLESVTILHELRHVASVHLKNKYPNEYFDDETDHKIEEDQQRIIDLYTLISTGDYKDGNIGFRGAHAFADKKDFATSLLLASKSSRLALKELDSLSVSVPDGMRDSVKKMKSVFEFQLGEKDQEYIQLVRESLERMKLKEEDGDAHMMELDSGLNRNSELFSTILPDFETIGGDRNSLSTDKLFTRGSYHITLRTAFNLAKKYPNSDVAKIYKNFSESNKGKSGEQRMKAWGSYMFENEQDEQTVANLLMEDNNNTLAETGVDTLGLTDGEYNGLHLFMWNAGAPSTKKAIAGTFDRLSKFRRILREDPNHPHKEEIEAHIKTLQYAAASSLLRTGKNLQAGHFIRDAVSRALVYDGRYISKEERAKIDGQTALSNGMEAHRKGQAVLGKYNEFERIYNYFNMTKRIPTPPPKPAEPLKPQIASAPTFEEVSPGPPPQQPIAPGIVTGVTEKPEEVIGLEAPVAPSLAKGDMQ